jgi:ABC-2 type transport system ATP-binding protein
MIQLSGFKKSYASRTILDVPTFSVGAGLFWIKGRNGAGKSTLFKSIAGLIPFEGDILIDGISQKKQPVRYRRCVTYSEAEPVFPAFLSARNLVRFVGETRGTEPAKQDQFCEQLGITTYFDTPCATYSSGMLKKTSLVLAFLGNPSVIILDEPLVTLDEASRQLLNSLIRERQQSMPDITFFVSSHEPLTHGLSELLGTYEIVEGSLRTV